MRRTPPRIARRRHRGCSRPARRHRAVRARARPAATRTAPGDRRTGSADERELFERYDAASIAQRLVGRFKYPHDVCAGLPVALGRQAAAAALEEVVELRTEGLDR